jgi:hypothetical protein
MFASRTGAVSRRRGRSSRLDPDVTAAVLDRLRKGKPLLRRSLFMAFTKCP